MDYMAEVSIKILIRNTTESIFPLIHPLPLHIVERADVTPNITSSNVSKNSKS